MSKRLSFSHKELFNLRKSIYFDKYASPYRYDAMKKIDNALKTKKSRYRIWFTANELDKIYRSVLYDAYGNIYKSSVLIKLAKAKEKEKKEERK